MAHNLHNTLQSMKGGKFYSLPQLRKRIEFSALERLEGVVQVVRHGQLPCFCLDCL